MPVVVLVPVMRCPSGRVPNGDATRIDDSVFGKVNRMRTLTVGNTIARLYALAMNGALSQTCAAVLSDDHG